MNQYFVCKSAKELRQKISEEEVILANFKQQLEELVHSCKHQWSAVVADHIYEPAYTIPGDPHGVGGVDHQLPCHVPAKTTYRWKRACTICGKVEFTSKTTSTTIETPSF